MTVSSNPHLKLHFSKSFKENFWPIVILPTVIDTKSVRNEKALNYNTNQKLHFLKSSKAGIQQTFIDTRSIINEKALIYMPYPPEIRFLKSSKAFSEF